MTDTEQRAKWLEMAQRKTRGIAFDASGIEVYTLGAESYLSICERITADAVAAERSRLAAAGEMTDGEIVAIARVVDSVASRQGEITALSVEMTMNQARALIAESAARATVVERERCARWHDRRGDHHQKAAVHLASEENYAEAADVVVMAGENRISAAAIRAGEGE